MSIVYLNGQYIPQEQATVSIFDRGFLFGDSIYEVVPYFDGHFLRAKEHLVRLDRSLAAIKLTSPLSHDEWLTVFNELVERNQDQGNVTGIYLQITRGADKNRSHDIPNNIKPNVVAFTSHRPYKSRQELEQGFRAITHEDTRRLDCYIKATSLLPNILLYTLAHQSGAIDAILIRNGNAIECTSSNLFMVKDGTVITPPLERFMLGGITRQLIIELCQQHNIPLKEAIIPLEQLRNADEIWVSGSSKEICPIIELDGTPVGNGAVGPMWQQVIELYEGFKQSLRSLPS